jgi:hypothetical protein
LVLYFGTTSISQKFCIPACHQYPLGTLLLFAKFRFGAVQLSVDRSVLLRLNSTGDYGYIVKNFNSFKAFSKSLSVYLTK